MMRCRYLAILFVVLLGRMASTTSYVAVITVNRHNNIKMFHYCLEAPQFAYKSELSIEDSVLIVLNRIYADMENLNTRLPLIL